MLNLIYSNVELQKMLDVAYRKFLCDTARPTFCLLLCYTTRASCMLFMWELSPSYLLSNLTGTHIYVQSLTIQDFVGFLDVSSDLTADGLSSAILNVVASAGVDLGLCHGQGYDGASSISGHLNGVQAIIRRHCTRTVPAIV
jgi:hypothetical protein